ncbi:MerR family transcriptional regulator [Streptosporangium sp. NPDC051023]|uniref:helix-turn-helix domain-containing protein n=1 Tax=Streptosporangium sp. NPDC051023 TaxID=3155410 RepID=UPI00344EDDC9
MEWTIGELAERASAALSPTAQLNGRVRDVPNERLIRWYATIGLLDPPSARRGRVALYGRRHLLQLIAVKRRQAEGLTIAEIQAELTGATDQTLESIADLRDPAEGNGRPERAAPRASRPRFWAEPLAAAETPGPGPTRQPGAPASRPRPPAPSAMSSAPPMPPPAPPASSAPSVPAAVVVHGVRLAPGVTLLLDGGGRTPSAGELAEIGAAAQALLAVLREHDLVPRDPQDQEGNQP